MLKFLKPSKDFKQVNIFYQHVTQYNIDVSHIYIIAYKDIEHIRVYLIYNFYYRIHIEGCVIEILDQQPFQIIRNSHFNHRKISCAWNCAKRNTLRFGNKNAQVHFCSSHLASICHRQDCLRNRIEKKAISDLYLFWF